MTTWRNLLAANQVFQGDLGIVDCLGEATVSPLSAPKRTGQYSLTDWSKLSEIGFLAHFKGVQATVLSGCIDYRYANWLHNYATNPLVRMAGKYLDTRIVSIYVAAGIAQEVDSERIEAMATIFSYLSENIAIKNLILTDHAHNCGGLGHFCFKGISVCQSLDTNPGSKRELEFVRKKIENSVSLIVPPHLINEVRIGIVTERKGRVVMVR